MLIPVVCKTNIDAAKDEVWPKLMFNPKVGDAVAARSGYRLYIKRIIHHQLDEDTFSYRDYFDTQGIYLEIELHTFDGKMPL